MPNPEVASDASQIDTAETGLAIGLTGLEAGTKPSPAHDASPLSSLPESASSQPSSKPVPTLDTSPSPTAEPVTNQIASTPAPVQTTSISNQPTSSSTPQPVAAPAAAGIMTAAARLGPNELSGLTASGPITIDNRNGVKITGLRISNPNGPCVIVRNASDIEIVGNAIGPCGGHGVSIDDSSRIQVIRNNLSDVRNSGVVTVRASSVQIRSNYLDKASTAFRAVRSTGVSIDFNGAMNVRGPFPDGQLAQFDNVHGGGNRIRCNATDLSVGGPDANNPTRPSIRTEDIINTWQSNGLSSDPILIAYNRLQGGGSNTGSGIMSGDGGGSWISVIGNRIVNPWNAGIGVAGGSNIRIERNRVISEQPKVANEGFYIRNFYPSSCNNITHQNNEIKWPPTNWSSTGWTQTFWNTNECSNITGTSSNNLNANLTTAIIKEPIAECRALASSMGFDPTGW